MTTKALRKIDIPYRVHTHDRISYRSCRRLWMFSSNMQGTMGLETKGRYSPFWMGTIWHKAIELYYEKGVAPVQTVTALIELWKAANVELMSNWEDRDRSNLTEDSVMLIGMARHYLQYAQETDDFKVIEAEVEFSQPIRDYRGRQLWVEAILTDPDGTGDIEKQERVLQPAIYEGRFDGVIQDKYGDVWLLENKTAVRVDGASDDLGDSPSYLQTDDQCGSYVWAAQRIYGRYFRGIMYNFAMKKLPMVPQLLKRGGMTVDQRVLKNTTLRIYGTALLDAGLHLGDYVDVLNQLHEQGWHPFFRRYWVRRSPEEIDEVGIRIMHEVMEMSNPQTVPYPNPSQMRCPRCPFLVPCVQMSKGLDWQSTLEKNYRKRVSTDVEVPDYMPM